VNYPEIVLAIILLAAVSLPAMLASLEVGSVTDARLHAKRGTDTRFDLTQYKSLEQWEPVAKRIRQQVLTSCGLSPMPEKTPLKAKVFGKIDRGDYTVENVQFQSYPGFYVVGNLYRPKGKPGPFPAVLCPHGHSENGRLEVSETFSAPARAANIAKLGMIAFTYSMIGYNENTQLVHRFAATPRQELWSIGPGALQLWNSIRAVDFVSSLPDVDPNRIGCTGESGGGTQTFMLSAVEPRIKVNSPVCMISAIMQGGCVCENAPLLRIDTNNVEIGSLMAPRPMMMIAATGDWTKDTLEREHPSTRQVYKLYGAEAKVGMFMQDTGHNYNTASREHVYPWLQRFLLNDKNAGDVTKEQPVTVEKNEDLVAFPAPPKDALNLDQLTDELIGMREARIDGFGLGSRSSLDRFRRTFGPGLRACFAVSVPKPEDITIDQRGSADLGSCTVTKLVIGRRGVGDAIPALLFAPKSGAKADPVLVVHPSGKSALLTNGAPGELIGALLKRGNAVLAIDSFLTGEADKADERLKDKFFTTFYRTDAAERVQDIVTALCYLSSKSGEAKSPLALSRRDSAVSKGAAAVDLIGLDKSGLDCLFARAFAAVPGSTLIDAAKFDASDQAFADCFFVPGIRRVGDIRTAAALVAPNRLVISNVSRGFPTEWVRRAYEASGAAGNVETSGSAATEIQTAAML
jgi:dienelactone hydrolase